MAKSNTNQKHVSNQVSKQISKITPQKKMMLSKFKESKDILEISAYYDVPPENMTLNGVLHKMSETLEMYLKILQQILQPEEFHALYECNAFVEKDKTRMMELYKKLIISHREILKAVIINEEQNLVSTIRFVHKEILDVKVEMLDIVNKMQQSWKNDAKENINKQMHYFG
ncbi:MAG: hypothetical protein ACP5NW_05820 [Candidatus Woesearchaeota archaeon]